VGGLRLAVGATETGAELTAAITECKLRDTRRKSRGVHSSFQSHAATSCSRPGAGRHGCSAHAAASAGDPLQHGGGEVIRSIKHDLVRAAAHYAHVAERLQLRLQQRLATQTSLLARVRGQAAQSALLAHLESHPVSVACADIVRAAQSQAHHTSNRYRRAKGWASANWQRILPTDERAGRWV
jgi:hypothetical protein